MRRLLTVSALFALAILTTTAIGQPPTAGDLQPKTGDKKAEKKANPTDALIASALANDPDVRMAKAKMMLAEAELAKARQTVTLRVLSLKASIENHKLAVQGAEERTDWAERMFKTGQGTQGQVLEARITLEKAKAALAQAEAELKFLTGGAGGVGLDPSNPDAVAQGLAFLMKMQAEGEDLTTTQALLALLASQRNVVKGPIPDRIRAALDKNVKLGAKGEKITFEKALEVFKKEAGLDVAVRGTYPMRPIVDPKNPGGIQNRPIEIVLEGEELPVGAWFQLFEDNAVFMTRTGMIHRRFRFYVRDYGLLITSADTAPPDAPSLTEFWKQKLPAPKPEPKSDPMPK
ncbi:MAG: TolC family protein [Planctomycetia bacterium]|nr:TolC family protein [Planctomycetia bacterium]